MRFELARAREGARRRVRGRAVHVAEVPAEPREDRWEDAGAGDVDGRAAEAEEAALLREARRVVDEGAAGREEHRHGVRQVVAEFVSRAEERGALDQHRERLVVEPRAVHGLVHEGGEALGGGETLAGLGPDRRARADRARGARRRRRGPPRRPERRDRGGRPGLEHAQGAGDAEEGRVVPARRDLGRERLREEGGGERRGGAVDAACDLADRGDELGRRAAREPARPSQHHDVVAQAVARVASLGEAVRVEEEAHQRDREPVGQAEDGGLHAELLAVGIVDDEDDAGARGQRPVSHAPVVDVARARDPQAR